MAAISTVPSGDPRRSEKPYTPGVTALGAAASARQLVMLDVENLRAGNLRLDWKALRSAVLGASPTATVRAVMTSPFRGSLAAFLRESGFSVFVIPQNMPAGGAPSGRLTNADPFYLQDLERVLKGRPGYYETVVLGTGDLGLATAAAKLVRRLTPQARVYTLSRAASTSHRINEFPWLFDGNLFLGRDLLRTPDQLAAARLGPVMVERPALAPARRPAPPAPSFWSAAATWLRRCFA